VVASVSCIYGLGLPENYFKGSIRLSVGDLIDRDEILKHLVSVHYERNDIELTRGSFRARGDIVEIAPSYDNIIVRIQMFGDEIEKISKIDPITGHTLEICGETVIFPAVHYLSGEEDKEETIALIKKEQKERVDRFKQEDKILEAQRLLQRD